MSTLDENLVADDDLVALPLDRSDDLALDLLGSFFTAPADFSLLVDRLVSSELLLRVETTSRLFWHMTSCVETQVARNRHLGLDPDEVSTRFLTQTRTQVLETPSSVPQPLLADALTDIAAVSFATQPHVRAIRLFSNAPEDVMGARVSALAGQVAAMRAALDL